MNRLYADNGNTSRMSAFKIIARSVALRDADKVLFLAVAVSVTQRLSTDDLPTPLP
jgi:hypothetical protein